MRHFASFLLLSLALTAAACSGIDDSSSSTTDGRDGRVGHDAEELKVVPPGPNKVYGIDVSKYQGTWNWGAEKGKGRVFAIARVGDGLGNDSFFASNWAGMKAAGLIRGAYQFFEPGDDPIAQADLLIAKVGKLGDGDLPATIDVEATGGQSAATIATRVGQWLARVEAGTGKKPIIYTGPYFWQDNVGSTAFSGYPLWIANYGVTAPQLPSAWSGFKMWQYSDSNGTLDLDLFNGSLAELQAFAGTPKAPAKGYLDLASCTGISGWAQDPASPTKAIGVQLWFDGASGAAGARSLPVDAGTARADLCVPLGSCNHGFEVPVPLGVSDGKPHEVFAYGVGQTGSSPALLTDAPKSFTCAAPPPPLAPAAAVKRWVPNPTVLAAWKLSTLTDVAHYDDATVATYARGADLEATPRVVIADDGAPEVYVVEDGRRRHVVSEASLAAWRFPAPTKTPAAELAAMPQGPDWRATVFGLEGSGPEIYVLDLAPDTPPGTETPGAAVVPSGADGAPRTPPSSDELTPPSAGGEGGCSISSPAGRGPSAPSSAMLGLVLAGALVIRRRRSGAVTAMRCS